MTIRIYPSSLEQATSDLMGGNFVGPLVEVLSKHDIKYSFTEGEFAYVVADKHILDAATTATNYPQGLIYKLYDKKQMQELLSEHGFITLTTETINNPDDISLTDFIVKLKEGSGGSLPASYAKNWFSGVSFADKEVFKRHPMFKNIFVPGKYVAQQAINPSNHTAVSFFCSVNSSGDTYFLKNSTDTWVNATRTKAVLSSEGYESTKELLAKFVKAIGIKNAVFSLQFIMDDAGVLYPMDWNFRWGKNFHKQTLKNAPDLYEFGILYMAGANPTPPVVSKEEWVATKEDIAALWV